MQDWYSCCALFENGWVPFSHICSSPGFAQSDLWSTRKERQETLKKMGIEVEDTGILINDETIEKDYPDLYKANHECDQTYWNNLYRSFGDKEDLKQPSVTIEMSDEDEKE